MKRSHFIVVLLLVVALTPVSAVMAAEQTYTATTFFSVPHTKPAWFAATNDGGFIGETVDGYTFRHSIVPNTSGIKLHQFAIGTASFYITDKGIITADSDLMAVSIYLTLA